MLLLWHIVTIIHITNIVIATFILRKQFIIVINTVESITVYGTDLKSIITTRDTDILIT